MRGALPRLRVALSVLCLFAASPMALAAEPTERCSGETYRECAPPKKPITYRVLQNLIPQPTVTYEIYKPPAVTETVRFLPRLAFAAGTTTITPELREELLGFLTSLEAYQRVERFEVIGHGDFGGGRLADRRAESVRFFLAERGIARSMMTVRGAAQADAATRGRIELLVTVRGRR